MKAREFTDSLEAIYVSTTATKVEPINDLFIQIDKKYTGAENITIKDDEEGQNQPVEEKKTLSNSYS